MKVQMLWSGSTGDVAAHDTYLGVTALLIVKSALPFYTIVRKGHHLMLGVTALLIVKCALPFYTIVRTGHHRH